MRIIFAAGGTGGHLSPAMNLAETLAASDPTSEVLFLTSGRGIETLFLGERRANVLPLFPHARSRPSLTNPLPWLRALFAVRRAVRTFRPFAVVATGGYVTLPVALALIGSGTRLYLLEQNAAPGRATRIAASFATRILCHYERAASLLGRRASAVGSPVAASLVGSSPTQEEARASFGLDPERQTLLVAGGSLGARKLNEIVLENLGAFQDDQQILHVTGERDFERVSRLYRETAVRAHSLPFCREMPRAYRAADLIFCRAGGMTVAETCAAGLPAVFVPYPHHRDRHQYHNAGLLQEADAGIIVDEAQVTGEGFQRHVVGLLKDSSRLRSMGEAARRLAKPRAAEEIVATIQQDLTESLSGRYGSKNSRRANVA